MNEIDEDRPWRGYEAVERPTCSSPRRVYEE